MMRGIRRLVFCTAAVGLLTAGAISASMEVAHADNVVGYCLGNSSDATPYKCTLKGTISDPAAITVTVTDNTSGASEQVNVNWTVQCTDNANGQEGTAGASTNQTPVTLNLTMPASADGQCNVTATVTLPGLTPTPTPTPTPTSSATATASPTATFIPNAYHAVLSYTPASSPSPSPSGSGSGVHPIKGFGGKCVDDNGNSSANRARIQIWTCSGSDQAENWKYSNGELIHNGKCMNDKGNGGSGSKVILYSCNGGSNEKWSELSNGELKLKAHNGTLCLDDPRSSTQNGTQLIVYRCQGSANQKWSLP